MTGKFLVISINDKNPKVREYKRRRFHTKDRRGCTSCRQQRVKCDQGKPVCARCERAGRSCRYGSAVTGNPPTPRSLPASDLAIVDSILENAPCGDRIQKGTSMQSLMHHATDTIGPVLGTFLDNSLWELICGHPFLLASILAVSASHLSYHAPDPSQYRVAECALLSTSLETFRPALAQPLTARRSDAFLMTSMLLNNLAFSRLETLDPLKSWVFDDREDRLSWLSLQMGLKPLLMASAPFREQSLLGPMYEASDDNAGNFSGKRVTTDRVPAHWVQLAMEMDEKINAVDGEDQQICENRPFHEAVRLLAEIHRLPPSVDNTFLYVQVFKALDIRFVRLLYDRDEGALWMFGYWLGLVGRLDMWWCKRRARRDWTAIQQFLSGTGVQSRFGQDGEMWRQLMLDFDSVRPPGTS